ncbi:uncharacterized protein RHIMIDRAFT_276970 [Rhizopus microsporus ATCC 52813]|uniref:Uncharacterized protein n=1 Tax=Rhizopus microsporus ATCC 52813 TaxID=1340429 RepID=A0A2G4T1Z5_RHIZD|nr:uncharacterized protein RHIMIDRAFT_276970 [Rhizopus microsporus ATCC 52813]PHZ15027.1 hypothetical protein RHIMIDRAFT_276970 [Rhizopus microsporus ATCC 52813]
MSVSHLSVSITTVEAVQVVKVERRSFGDKIKTSFDLILLNSHSAQRKICFTKGTSKLLTNQDSLMRMGLRP